MSILKSYNDGTITELNSLRYSEIPRGAGPLVEAKVPTNALEQGPSRNAITTRTQDVSRLTQLLLRTPAGGKFAANQALVHLAERERFQNLNEKGATLKIAGKLAGVLATTPLAAAIAGTGLHTVHGGLEGFLGEWYKYLGKDGTTQSIFPGNPFKKREESNSSTKFIKSGLEGTVKEVQKQGGQYVKIDDSNTATYVGHQEYTEEGDFILYQNSGSVISIADVKNDETLVEKRYLNRFTTGKKYSDSSPENKINYNKEDRNLLGDPGKISYNLKDPFNIKLKDKVSSFLGADKINALSPGGSVNPEKTRDLIKFRFEVITPDTKKFLYFRAFLSAFDDDHSAQWSSFNYVGRGEQFHTYNTYQRSVSLGFKIAAQSRWEMKPLYEKINWLASATAPTYSAEGFMRGTFVRLTVGSYLYSVPGILESVKYTWQTDYPWEIAMNEPEGGSDVNMRELPMVLDCSIQFRPIHTNIQETGKPTFVTSAIPEEYGSLQQQLNAFDATDYFVDIPEEVAEEYNPNVEVLDEADFKTGDFRPPV